MEESAAAVPAPAAVAEALGVEEGRRSARCAASARPTAAGSST